MRSLLVLLLVLATVAGWAPTTHALTLTRLGVYSPAVSSKYPSILTLKAHAGRVYLGYGNWETDHPAVVVGCYRPETGTFHTEFSIGTDCVSQFRTIDGALYVAHLDPVHYEDNKDLSYRAGGVWRDMAGLAMVHVFDVDTVTGTDLWCVGAYVPTPTNNGGAAVFRSVDGGRTWTNVTLATPETRYYYGFGFRGRFYVRDTVYDTNGVGQRVVAGSQALRKTVVVGTGGNEILAAAGGIPGGAQRSVGGLGGFTGTNWISLRVPTVYDFTWDGTHLFTAEPGGIYRGAWGSNGLAWESLNFSNVPTNSTAIEVMDGVVYVGDTNGYLWAGRLDGGPLVPGSATVTNDVADEFGRALAIHGDTVAVGAAGESSRGTLAGQVTIWDRVSAEGGATWERTAVIDPPVPSYNGWFGRYVA